MTGDTRPSDDEIDARIARWHVSDRACEVYDALGWTWQEYSAWVRDPNAVPPRPLPVW